MNLIAFGDSMTAGYGVSLSYPYLAAIAKVIKLSVLAVSGAMAADQADAIYAYVPQAVDQYTYMIGANDERIYGTDPLKLANFKTILAAEAYYLTQAKANARSWAQSSGWTTNAPYTIGVKSSTVGAGLTTTFTGTTLTFGYIIQDGNGGAFSVSIDGAPAVNFNVSNGAAIATQLGRTYAPALGRVNNLSDGPHTVIFTVTTAGTVYLDWIGIGASGYPLTLLSIPKMTAAGYASLGGSAGNIDSYNAAILALVFQMQSDGLPVRFADGGAAVTPATDLQADGFHPNQQGQVNISSVGLP